VRQGLEKAQALQGLPEVHPEPGLSNLRGEIRKSPSSKIFSTGQVREIPQDAEEGWEVIALDEFEFVISETPALESPVFIEGLPGVGNVGRIVATHLISVFGGRKFGELYSTSFPHQVKNLPDGTLRMMRNEIHFTSDPLDMVILTGDMQPLPTDFGSHYRMANSILEFCGKMNVKSIIAVGGYALGEDTDGRRKVFVGTSSPGLAGRYEGPDVKLLDEEPGTPIVGVSGLLPAMSSEIDAVCLLGQTSGDIKPDVEAASAVLDVISSMLDIQIDLNDLEKASQSIEREMEDIMNRIQKVERLKPKVGWGKEGYIH